MSHVHLILGLDHTPPWVMGGAEPFFRMFIQEGLKSNWDFGWELAL